MSLNRGYEAKAVTAAIASLIVWSSAFAGVSVVVTSGAYTPGATVLLRFLIASATMAVIAPFAGVRLPRAADVPRIALAAAFGITAYHLAFTFGEVRVSASAASLIIASGPIWTALLAAAFLKERLNGWGWGGVLLAFGGVAAISFGEGSGRLAFEPMALLVLAAALSTAIYFVLSKKPLESYSAFEFTSYAIWFGTIPLLVFLPQVIRQLPTAPASATWTVVFLGVFPGALAYFLWSYALARMPASTTSSFLYAQPVIATLVAWAWQHVVPGPLTLLGGAIALGGVVLVQTRGRLPEPQIVVTEATSTEAKAQVRELVEELLDYFVDDLGLGDRAYYAEELADFDDWYGPPRGVAFLATVGSVPAGCTLIKAVSGDVAELRRVYVRPAYRRRGLARRLVKAAADEARSRGYRRIQFITSEHLEGAIELYTSEGFEPMPLYREALSETAVAFGKDL